MTEKIVAIADSVTVGELATTLNLPVTTLIGELFKNGIAATINQRLDFETASIIVEELGLEVTLKKKGSCCRSCSCGAYAVGTGSAASTDCGGDGAC